MIRANVTKFGQNFIAPKFVLAGTPIDVLVLNVPCLFKKRFNFYNFLEALQPMKQQNK